MNYGVYVSASGALTAMYRTDVLANNLANAQTVGFKPDQPATRFRDPARTEDNLPFMPSNALLEKLGAGVLLMPSRTNFEQGPVEITNNPLDVAIRGDGFFVVRDSSDSASDRVRLTRDGRFLQDQNGRLVMASNGLPVMDMQNRPIFLRGDAPVNISPDGSVRQNGELVAQIQLARVVNTAALTKLGESLFLAPPTALANRQRADGLLSQGAVEGSAVDEVTTMMRLSAASRAIESNIGMITYHDRMNERAINTLGRIS